MEQHHFDPTDEKCSCNCDVWVCAECGLRQCEAKMKEDESCPTK